MYILNAGFEFIRNRTHVASHEPLSYLTASTSSVEVSSSQNGVARFQRGDYGTSDIHETSHLAQGFGYWVPSLLFETSCQDRQRVYSPFNGSTSFPTEESLKSMRSRRVLRLFEVNRPQ